jgi:hypothetical protein
VRPEELRRQGTRGGAIRMHRAMATAPRSPWLLAHVLLVPAAITIGAARAMPALTALWSVALARLHAFLGLPGTVVTEARTPGGVLEVSVPFFTAVAGAPGAAESWVVGVACALALAVSFALPERFMPLVYFLRFATLVQLTAFAYFAFAPGPFPYDLPRYVRSSVELACLELLVVPGVLGLTLFPFGISLWRKVAVTLLVLGHLAVLIPLQVSLHAFLIYHLSLLVMPPLFFLWGVLVHVFIFIALYAWAMSWPAADERRARAVARRVRATPSGAAGTTP